MEFSGGAARILGGEGTERATSKSVSEGSLPLILPSLTLRVSIRFPGGAVRLGKQNSSAGMTVAGQFRIVFIPEIRYLADV
jgi:hypothetical protein